ncbi:MAG: hypothetical protein IT348_11555, partial [Candidatus Eisenbacteria bacterium]|nr:hypothetical protein [Candidatus Eisenbacteria bacterium]
MNVARLAVTVLLAVTVSAGRARAELPYPATHGEWHEVTTSRFRVYSDAGVAPATRAARHLERLAEAMEKTRAGLRVDSTRKVCVYAFRDAESFRPYVENAGDDYGTTVGYQLAGCDVDYLMYFIVPGNRSLAFASHEFTHAAVSRTLGRMPVWISEGLAEYFSTFESRSRRAQIGRPVPGSRRRLRDRVQPLRTFLLVGQNSPEYSHGPHRSLLYAQSWELVHMLLQDDESGPARFGTLLRRLAAGVPSADALAQVYGPGAVDSLERRLRRRVFETTVRYQDYDFDSAFVTVPVRARTLERAETQLLLGELLAHAYDSQLPD